LLAGFVFKSACEDNDRLAATGQKMFPRPMPLQYARQNFRLRLIPDRLILAANSIKRYSLGMDDNDKNGKDMNLHDKAIAIRAAIKNGETQQTLALIGTDQEVLDVMTPFGGWIHVAAKEGNLNLVRALVEMGADVNRRGGTFDGGAINLAAAYGRYDVVMYLLKEGAELDTSEPERNPLWSAILAGHIEIVRLLITAGIDFRIKYTGESMKGMDAHAFAVESGQKKIAELLKTLE
jgi:ankyrin repeat protein